MSHEEITALVAEIDAETTRVGEYIATLANQVSTGMTAEQVAAVKGGLTASVARLKSLGANPEVPIPPETPEFSRLRGKR